MNDSLTLNYEMFTVDESDFDKDILTGSTLDIMLLLMAENRTSTEISRNLNLPMFTTQLYLSRLLKANFIKVECSTCTDGKIEKVYSLAFKDISILSAMNSNNKQDTSNDDKTMIAAKYFVSITSKAIQQVTKNQNKPHKVKAYYMRTSSAKMNEFKKELDKLFERFQGLEDEAGNETYSLVTILAPIEDNK